MLRRLALLVGIAACQGCIGGPMFGWVPLGSNDPETAPETEIATKTASPARCAAPAPALAIGVNASIKAEAGPKGRSAHSQVRSTRSRPCETRP